MPQKIFLPVWRIEKHINRAPAQSQNSHPLHDLHSLLTTLLGIPEAEESFLFEIIHSKSAHYWKVILPAAVRNFLTFSSEPVSIIELKSLPSTKKLDIGERQSLVPLETNGTMRWNSMPIQLWECRNISFEGEKQRCFQVVQILQKPQPLNFGITYQIHSIEIRMKKLSCFTRCERHLHLLTWKQLASIWERNDNMIRIIVTICNQVYSFEHGKRVARKEKL